MIPAHKGRALKGTLALLMASLLVGAAAQNAPAPAEPTPASAPVSRESRLELPFDAPVEASSLVLAQALPAGASYLPGSSTLNGQPTADPLLGASGRLYWPIPATERGVLAYRVSHTGALGTLPQPALLVLYPRDRQEVLQGPFDLKDYAAAQPLMATASENPGPIKLPLDGSVVRDRDRVTVVVQRPAGSTAQATLNGEPLPEAALGQTDLDRASGQERLSYFGILLHPGENRLSLGGESVRVFYAGQTSRVEVQGLQLLADGSTPLRLHLRALDAGGLTTAQPTLTLRSSIEPQTPDADPSQGGYQIALKDGEADLILPPQSAPGTLTLEFLIGDRVQRESFTVAPDLNTLGVGAASATLGLSGGQAEFRWSAKGYLETPLSGGKLYAAANKDGLPIQSDPNQRFPLYGDSSTESVPLQGLDPIAFRYEAPSFSVGYRQTALPIDVLPLGERLTALTASTKGDFSVGGFAALVPGDRVSGERLIPNGTRLLRLAHGEIAPDSETLELLTLEPVSGKELARRTLTRFADYVLDPETGVITLSQPLTAVDQNLNNVVVQAAYRLQDGGQNRQWAYGGQLKYQRGPFSAGVAAVNLDGTLTGGLSARYATADLNASALAMTAGGGVQLSGDASGRLGAGTTFGVHARYQDSAYSGLAPFTPGLTLGGSVQSALSPQLTGQLGADYQSSASSQQGNVAARVDYRLNPFSVGGGLRYSFGDQTGLSGLLGVGYHAAPFDLDITHSQPITGNVDPKTLATFKYALAPNVRLSFTDDLNWRTGQKASFGLDTALGGTNLSAAYDLPNADGSGNRARFGVDTTLALNDLTSLGLRGAYTRDLNAGTNDFSVGSDLRFKTDRLSAGLGGDLAFSAGQWRGVVRAGVTGSLSDQLSLSADGLADLSATPGSRFSLGYAYRSGPWNSLGYLRYQNGSLAGNNPQLLSQLAAEYHTPSWALRGGLDARVLLNDPGSFTYQPSLGASVYITDYLGVGAWGRALVQPSSGTTQLGLGLEGSLRALPGTWLSLGYNVLGFDGIGNTFTKTGPYVRLDLLLDEQGGQK